MQGALGFHYLIELYQCNKQMLTNQAFIKKTLKEAVKIAGANEVGDIFHEFKPMGVSGVILISESHFSIHTWPEYEYAAIDLFTCNASMKTNEAYQFLVHTFRSKKSSIMEIQRGLEHSEKSI